MNGNRYLYEIFSMAKGLFWKEENVSSENVSTFGASQQNNGRHPSLSCAAAAALSAATPAAAGGGRLRRRRRKKRRADGQNARKMGALRGRSVGVTLGVGRYLTSRSINIMAAYGMARIAHAVKRCDNIAYAIARLSAAEQRRSCLSILCGDMLLCCAPAAAYPRSRGREERKKAKAAEKEDHVAAFGMRESRGRRNGRAWRRAGRRRRRRKKRRKGRTGCGEEDATWVGAAFTGAEKHATACLPLLPFLHQCSFKVATSCLTPSVFCCGTLTAHLLAATAFLHTPSARRCCKLALLH
jgi:hypothetical protein